MKHEYITYKFYNNKGNRLAIKAEEYNGRLLFSVVACSKQDQFSKRVARAAFSDNFEGETYHPEKFSIPIKDGKGGKTFIDYCNQNYFRLRTIPMEVEVEVYTKDIAHLGDIYDSIEDKHLKIMEANRIPFITNPS